MKTLKRKILDRINQFIENSSLELKIGVGFTSAILVFGILFSCEVLLGQSPSLKQKGPVKNINKETLSQIDNAIIQSFKKKVKTLEEYVRVDSINRQMLLTLSNEIIPNLELKIDSTEKYVAVGQKNLDMWLRLLSILLSLVIGISVYTGLKDRETALKELKEIRDIKKEISSQIDEAEKRLTMVRIKLTEIEDSSAKSKTIVSDMTTKLNEFASKETLVLDEAGRELVTDTIAQAKEELQKSGLESLKNLYLAKALKSYDEKDWTEVVRLLSNYIDLYDQNSRAYFKRAYALGEIAYQLEDKEQTDGFEKAIKDYTKVIQLESDYANAYNNRAIAYKKISKFEDSLRDYNDAIKLRPEFEGYYSNRAQLFETMGKADDSEKDKKKVVELKALKGKAS